MLSPGLAPSDFEDSFERKRSDSSQLGLPVSVSRGWGLGGWEVGEVDDDDDGDGDGDDDDDDDD
eukprot:1626349-Rhodomonas_salina.1